MVTLTPEQVYYTALNIAKKRIKAPFPEQMFINNNYNIYRGDATVEAGQGIAALSVKHFSGKNQEQGRGIEILQTIEKYYSILEDGKIWNKRKKKYVAQTDNGCGRKKVGLYIDGEKVSIKVHRLVALKFVPNLELKPQVNHIDGNKTNNHYANLEWVTHQENTDHAKKNGLMWFQKGKK